MKFAREAPTFLAGRIFDAAGFLDGPHEFGLVHSVSADDIGNVLGELAQFGRRHFLEGFFLGFFFLPTHESLSLRLQSANVSGGFQASARSLESGRALGRPSKRGESANHKAI